MQTPAPIEMRPGTLIDYRMSLRGVPMRWRSEITEWDPPTRFADRQRRGPYREWYHAHTFEDRDGGTLVHDVVRYRLIGPGLLTRAINALLVAPDTRRIFTFRHAALERALGLEGRTRSGPVCRAKPDLSERRRAGAEPRRVPSRGDAAHGLRRRRRRGRNCRPVGVRAPAPAGAERRLPGHPPVPAPQGRRVAGLVQPRPTGPCGHQHRQPHRRSDRDLQEEDRRLRHRPAGMVGRAPAADSTAPAAVRNRDASRGPGRAGQPAFRARAGPWHELRMGARVERRRCG